MLWNNTEGNVSNSPRICISGLPSLYPGICVYETYWWVANRNDKSLPVPGSSNSLGHLHPCCFSFSLSLSLFPFSLSPTFYLHLCIRSKEPYKEDWEKEITQVPESNGRQLFQSQEVCVCVGELFFIVCMGNVWDLCQLGLIHYHIVYISLYLKIQCFIVAFFKENGRILI